MYYGGLGKETLNRDGRPGAHGDWGIAMRSRMLYTGASCAQW